MRLLELTYKDLRTGWNIKAVRFDSLSLFVGASGVGKTKILRSIMNLAAIASGRSFNGVGWKLIFMEGDKRYVWSGEFAVADDHENVVLEPKADFQLSKESLTVVSSLSPESDSEERASVNSNKEIFCRDESGLRYHGHLTVKLDTARSAIELLKEESDVFPVYEGFRKIIMLDMAKGVGMHLNPSFLNSNKASFSIAEIKNRQSFTPIDRLYLISKYHRELFDRVQDTFRDIFPTVEEIDFTLYRMPSVGLYPVIKIKEQGVESWIEQRDISNGMMRSLNQVITLALAEDGDVILIDEFENGLGINCIELLAEMAVSPEVRVQIIMTSHHPYIINAIPFKDWRIVTRNGSDVRVHTADQLRIGEKSKHEAFMQLLQSEEFTTGLA